MGNQLNDSFLSLQNVSISTGLSANTIFAASMAGSFPEPIPLDGDLVWISSCIADWIEIHMPRSSAFVSGVAA